MCGRGRCRYGETAGRAYELVDRLLAIGAAGSRQIDLQQADDLAAFGDGGESGPPPGRRRD